MNKLKKILIISLILITMITISTTNFANANVKLDSNFGITDEFKQTDLKATNIGIGGGGMLHSPVFSTFDSNTILISTDMGGVYVSHNSGEDWKRKNLKGTVITTAADPNRAGVLYAGGSGLWRSTNNGDDFELIFPNKDDIITRITQNENGLQYLYTKSGTYPTKRFVKNILINPNNSDNIFVLMYYSKKGFVFESKDNGETFNQLFTFSQTKPDKNIFYELAKLVYKSETDELYCITDEQVLKYDRQNNQVNSIYESELGIVNIAQVKEGENTQVIVVENTDELENSEMKIYYTNDFKNKTDITQKMLKDLSNSFTLEPYGQVNFKWKFKYLDATSLNNIYITHATNVTGYPWSIDAIIKFNGETSKILYGNPFRNHVVIKNKGWNDGCTASYGIAISRQNPDMYVQTTLCGVNYSPDGDAIYQRSTKPIQDGKEKRYVTTGIDEQTTYGVRINPFNKNNILLLNTDLGLIISEDNANSWVRTNKGIKSSWVNTIYDAQFDKRKEGIVYSIWAGRHDAPYSPGNETDNANVHGGFAISYDGGKTWDSTYSTGIPENTTPVKLGIVYPENSEELTIYVATFKDGFFVSYDSGKTFIQLNDGIEKVSYKDDENYKYILASDIEVTEDGRVFGMTARSYYSDGNKNVQPGEVFELINNRWEKIDLLSNDVSKNVTCPRDIYYHNGTLYICSTCTAKYDYKDGLEFHNFGGGIITYKDGKIEQIFDESIGTTGVQIDTEGVLYVSDLNGNIYRKQTGDNEFKKIYDSYHSISKGIQLFDDDVLYLSALGGGVLKLENLKSLKQNPNSVAKTDDITNNRINEIRNTKNTDISNRIGKVYYLSSNGNDANDGLTKDSAWKTIDKLNEEFTKKTIKDNDTILLKRGDTYRGSILLQAHNITIGSYGDETLPKPELLVSPYDATKIGDWTQVDANIWKYTIDGKDPFKKDVGVIWFYSNNKESYGQKIITNFDTSEDNLDLKTILDSDLEFYQLGHAYSGMDTGGTLYVYSKENPKERFDRIEFSIASHGINVWGNTNLVVDNLTIKYAGVHGIGAGTLANLKVTNCELGYIGGCTQSYKDGLPIRFGNAIEIYGSVTDTNNYKVDEGFIVRNNYIYQVYDAGVTFQITTENESKIENAIFDNNVIEYCNYNVEYWNECTSQNSETQQNTYINNYEITNNIMRYSGYGVCQTRPDHNQSAHIKTWHPANISNHVKGKYLIQNNIFDTAFEQALWIYAYDKESLPQIKGNTFYNSSQIPLGYVYDNEGGRFNIPYVKGEILYPDNEYHYLEDDIVKEAEGTTGDLNWSYENGTLSIYGTGKMDDYSLANLPPWYQYKTFIDKIIIGESVTHIGEYAFYDLSYVEELEINCIALEDFSKSGINIGSNYSFYKTGSLWKGMDVTIGENVTVIPAFMFWPAIESYEAPNVKTLTFKGNKIKEVRDHAFLNLKAKTLEIPEGVEKIQALAFANSSKTIAISIPDTVTYINEWAFAGNTKLEKIVFSKNVNEIKEYVLNSAHSLKEVIFPSNIEFRSANYNNLFNSKSDNTIVYGNETAKTLVDNYLETTGKNNIQYSNINNSNINVLCENPYIKIDKSQVKFGDTITLKAKNGYEIEKINVTKTYTDTNGIKHKIGNMTYAQKGDLFTIENVKWDIDIDVVTKANTILGDVDGDKEMTVNDLAKIKLHLIEKEILTDAYAIKSADIDKDGEITANDLARLKLHLIGLLDI